MDSKLFAFRVATPIEYLDDEPASYTYDPQSQTAVWTGSGRAVAALHCTSGSSGGHQKCNAYGTYCNATGTPSTHHYRCDS